MPSDDAPPPSPAPPDTAALVESTASQALRELLDSLPPEVRLAGIKPEDLAVLSPEARLAGLPPEARLAGIAPADRLAGLPPEARLAGLPVPQTVLALPDEILRVLPESYLATLPADVQAAVRARLAR
ncbi:MAG: hypothetical protein U0324_47485 [Polyangiales bacterium]